MIMKRKMAKQVNNDWQQIVFYEIRTNAIAHKVCTRYTVQQADANRNASMMPIYLIKEIDQA